MGVYQLGTAVTITETFSVLGTPTDPTTVVYEVFDPLGVSTTYTFGVDVEVTNPSVGVYVLDLPAATEPGTWRYSITGTGTVVAVGQGEFTILPVVDRPADGALAAVRALPVLDRLRRHPRQLRHRRRRRPAQRLRRHGIATDVRDLRPPVHRQLRAHRAPRQRPARTPAGGSARTPTGAGRAGRGPGPGTASPGAGTTSSAAIAPATRSRGCCCPATR